MTLIEGGGGETSQRGMSRAVAGPAGGFDAGVLRGLVGDEPALMREIVGCFDDVATAIRVEFLQAARAADAGSAAMLAHRLKSSARSVGAIPLALLCERLEAHVDAGRTDALAPLVEQVVAALDTALVAMRQWRGVQADADMTRYGT